LETAGWEVLRSFAVFSHAAGLDKGHHDLKVTQLEPALGAVVPGHGMNHSKRI
jgi:hypothetical protein